jgi:hypothetical protein
VVLRSPGRAPRLPLVGDRRQDTSDRQSREGIDMATRSAIACPIMLALFAITRTVIAAPISIGRQTQIFVDDDRIAVKKNVRRTIHPCRKLPKPVVEPEKPWEGVRVYVYGSVYYDQASRQFRMWYMSCPRAGQRDPRLTRSTRQLMLYATSTDGVRWIKPNLGLYEYGGSKDNNIVLGLDSPSVLVDVQEPDPTKRYKLIGRGGVKGRGTGGWAAFSADGIHWKDNPVNPVFKTGDTLTLTRDPHAGEYLCFHKANVEIRGYRRRLVCLRTSKDLQTWSDTKRVMTPDAKDDTWAKQPGQRTEFYNMSVFPYGGQFLGMVTVFRKERRLTKNLPDQSRDDGPIHVELTHSRDGRTWRRLDERTPIIPNGPGKFDAGCILGLTNTPVIRDDEVWQYYTGITTTHGGAMPAKRITICRAAWRLDGFVSLNAGDQTGIVETVPLRLPAGQLIVNANATGGSLRVEILDEDGKPLPGYGHADCAEINTDSVRHVVRWQRGAALGIDQPVRLRFHLRRCGLFAYACRPLGR